MSRGTLTSIEASAGFPARGLAASTGPPEQRAWLGGKLDRLRPSLEGPSRSQPEARVGEP